MVLATKMVTMKIIQKAWKRVYKKENQRKHGIVFILLLQPWEITYIDKIIYTCIKKVIKKS